MKVIKKLFKIGFFDIIIPHKINVNNLMVNFYNRQLINPIFLYKKIKDFLNLFVHISNTAVILIYNTNMYISNIVKYFASKINYIYYYGLPKEYLINNIIKFLISTYNDKLKIQSFIVLIFTDSLTLMKNFNNKKKYNIYFITNLFYNYRSNNLIYFNINSIMCIKIFFNQLILYKKKLFNKF